MNILVTGAGGQLASELMRTTPAGLNAMACSREELDITDAKSVSSYIARHKPEVVINAAAYTAVDQAEDERDAAFAVNRDGVENLARACSDHTYLLTISTDFVFDGDKSRPYTVTDGTKPISVYGESKLAGEHMMREIKPRGAATIRTSWVYSAYANNFVKSMLRLMREKPHLGIVCDQVGTPTWANGLANACWETVSRRLVGTFHWSDAGVASWYDFAVAIQNMAVDKGLLEKQIPINPIATEAYPLPAKRPAYSVMDTSTLRELLPNQPHLHWQTQLGFMLDDVIRCKSA